MRAIAIERFGGAETLVEMKLPTPEPKEGEILIRVAASGINPVDWKIREGMLAQAMPHVFPLIPGWEASGYIEATGKGASRFKRGDAVMAYTRKPEVQAGTYAEYVTVPESFAAPVPKSLLFHEAAGVPLAGLTAWQALFREPGVAAGKTVLIQAASGGVGAFAAQLAKSVGAIVLGTAGSANQAFLREIGVDHPIDRTAGDFRDAVRAISPEGVDMAFDCAGGDTLTKSFDVVRSGGRLVSIVDTPDAEEAKKRGIRAYFHFVEPNGQELEKVGDLIESGKVRVYVSSVYRLADAAQAQIASREGHTRGKSVLVL